MKEKENEGTNKEKYAKGRKTYERTKKAIGKIHF